MIDLPYHLGWLKRLIGGDFASLYFPGQLSQVPPEWNLDVLIPKSPLFYMTVWPLGLFKGLDLGPAVLFVVSLLDAMLVPALFVLARRASRSGALWAAGCTRFCLSASMPSPTASCQRYSRRCSRFSWCSYRPSGPAVCAASSVRGLGAPAHRLADRFPNGPGLQFTRHRIARCRVVAPHASQPDIPLRLLAGLGLSLVLSVVLYYGLYIPPFFTRTLPALAGGTSLKGQELWPGGPAE